MIVRGTTPIHEFRLSIPVKDISRASIAYKQGDSVIINKDTRDLKIDSDQNTIGIALTSEETMQFKPVEQYTDNIVLIQVALKTNDGEVYVSNVIKERVTDVLSDNMIVNMG